MALTDHLYVPPGAGAASRGPAAEVPLPSGDPGRSWPTAPGTGRRWHAAEADGRLAVVTDDAGRPLTAEHAGTSVPADPVVLAARVLRLCKHAASVAADARIDDFLAEGVPPHLLAGLPRPAVTPHPVSPGREVIVREVRP